MLSFSDEMSTNGSPDRLFRIGARTQPRTEATEAAGARKTRRRQLRSLQAKAVAIPPEHDASAQKA